MLSTSGIVRQRSVGGLVRALAAAGFIASVACLCSQAQAGCPTSIRVPEDAPSINAAAAMICAGTTAEIVVGPGMWPASIATAMNTEVTVRGSGVGVTTIVPTSAGGQLVVNASGAYSWVRFVQATVEGGGGYNWRVAFANCRVQSSNANFLTAGRTVSDTVFDSCVGGPIYGTLYAEGEELIDRCTFNNCTRPILLWGDGGAQGHIVRDCTFNDCAGYCVQIQSSCCSFGNNRSTIVRCVFTNTNGRAISFRASQASGAQTPVLEVIDSQFAGNHTTSPVGGAAILIGGAEWDYSAAQSSTTVTDCTFTGNSAPSGGAIYTKKNQPLTLVGCTFSQNSATSGGGGAISQEFGGVSQSLTSTNCTFSGNSALGTGRGGSILLTGWNGIAALIGCIFQSNTATTGGALSVDRQQLSVAGCTFDGNSASQLIFESGGAIHSSDSTGGSITGSVFRDNHGAGLGGALSFYSGCTAAITGCRFENNGAAQGGAITIHQNCTQQIQQCVFEGNQATQSGPAAAFFGPSGFSTISDSHFGYTAGDAPSQLIVYTHKTANASVANSTFCGLVAEPMSGPTDGGGNCVTESCTDSDGDGVPDGCEVVTVPGNYATIQAAIDATAAGDFRIISVAAGTYAGAVLFNGKDVVVRGAGSDLTILDGTGLSTSVVRFTGGEPATAGLEALTVRNGTSGTAITGPPQVLRVGGGVYGLNSSAFIHNCKFELNRSDFGGGVYLKYSNIDVADCEFDSNIATVDAGGGMWFRCAGTVSGCTFTANHAGYYGPGSGSGCKGVGNLVAGDTLLITDCSFTGNIAHVEGAAIEVYEDAGSSPGKFRIHDCQITGNNSGWGTNWVGAGGVNNSGPQDVCTLSGNTSICDNQLDNVSGPYLLAPKHSVEVCDCEADIWQNGIIDGGDLGVMLSLWGSSTVGDGDITHDGVIDGADLSLLLASWGPCAR